MLKFCFVGINNRLTNHGEGFEGIVLDNCCSVKNKFKNIFGDDVVIKLDIFHAIQRIIVQIPKRQSNAAMQRTRRIMIKELRLCFRKNSDIGHIRKEKTPSPEELENNFHRFLKRWETEVIDDINVLPPTAVNEVYNLLHHVRSSCLSDIPPGVGTNRNERLHRKMRKWINKNRIGVSYAVAVLFLMFYVHMERKEKLKRGAKGGQKHVIAPVTRWYQEFLEKGDQRTSEKFGIGVNVRDLPSDVSAGSEDSHGHISPDIYKETDSTNSSEESDSDAESRSTATVSAETANNLVGRARVMENVTKNIFKNTSAPMISDKTLWLDYPASLLLFSYPESNIQCDYDKAVERVKSMVENYGFKLIDIAGDGDCCFNSVGHGLESFFQVESSPIVRHLTSVGIFKGQDEVDRIMRLRELVVAEWLGEFSSEYSMFLTVADQSSFHDMAQRFIQRGVFDCELGNSVLMALANILKCPIVVFTSIDTYPIIPLIPRESPLSVIPIYVAFNQTGKGHYNALCSVPEEALAIKETDVENEVMLSKKSSCRCGQGRAKVKVKSFCIDYGSRCKCFQQMQGCNNNCGCRNCGNPHGEKKANPTPTQSRKRRKHDTTPKTSSEFVDNHGEQLPHGKWSDFERFILQQIVQNRVAFGEQEPDYDKICQEFLSVMTHSGNTSTTTTQTTPRIKAMAKNILSQRNLTLTLLQREMENSLLNQNK